MARSNLRLGKENERRDAEGKEKEKFEAVTENQWTKTTDNPCKTSCGLKTLFASTQISILRPDNKI